MQIREANNGDLTRLARLYEASVRVIGPQRYTRRADRSLGDICPKPNRFQREVR